MEASRAVGMADSDKVREMDDSKDPQLSKVGQRLPEALTVDESIELLKQAEKLGESGKFNEAEEILLHVLRWSTRVRGSEDISVALTLGLLASLYKEQGLYGKAEPLFRRALSINEKVLGPDHKNTAVNLVNLALLYSEQGQYAKAEPLFLKGLQNIEKTLGPDHPNTTATLNNLASMYRKQGKYSKSEPLFLKALATQEKILGPEHPDLVSVLNNLSLLYSEQDQYTKAEALLLRALSISEKALGLYHPTTAANLNNLASVYSKQGQYVKAEQFFLRGLSINEKVLGPNHPKTAENLDNLALQYMEQGELAKAEPLFLRALAVNEKALGAGHLSQAYSLNNLASLYRELGQLDKIESLLLRALAIIEKSLGADHPATAIVLDNLGSLYENQNKYFNAASYFVRALAIREKALGHDHSDVSKSLNNLACLYIKKDQFVKAEALFTRALAINEKALGPIHPETAISLNNLAFLYQRRGQYAKAEPLSLRALAITQKTFGPEHPDTVTRLNNLSGLYAEQKNYGRSLDYLGRGLSLEWHLLVREGSLQPIVGRETLSSTFGRSWMVPFSLSAIDSSAGHLALSTRLNRQGLLQEIEQRQNLLARAPGPQQQLASQVAALNRQVSSVALKPEQRSQLGVDRDRLEAQLYRQLPALKIPEVTPKQIAAALPTDGVLVEFQRYQPFDGKQPPNQRWGSARYLALILKPSGSVTAVQLGEAKPIEEAITNALSATSQSLGDAPASLAAISRLVLDPLKPHLAGSRQWFLSPDGELNRVPFAALPSPLNPGQTLAEAVQLRLLTTGRDLLRFQQPAAKGNAALVMANPAYDRRPGAGGSGPAVALAINPGPGQRRSSSVEGRRWPALPATAAEGTHIAVLLGTTPVTGAEATVKRLEGSVSPRVLHIATHGFFAPDQVSKPDGRLVGLMENSPMLAGFKGEEPMLRSGLVLAGANQPTADPSDDGLLTASEATGLQLVGTELVVLSACATGLGDIRTGEGVYGLQRALAVAGARSTLLSLWKVDDAATAAFMEAYYKRLKAGEGRAAALAATQAEFRQHANIPWRHPYVWAAWQLTGDWRPLQGL